MGGGCGGAKGLAVFQISCQKYFVCTLLIVSVRLHVSRAFELVFALGTENSSSGPAGESQCMLSHRVSTAQGVLRAT